MLEVLNASAKDLYVSVLDLRADGVIAPLWPHPFIPASVNDNKISPRRDSEGNPVWQRIPFPFVFKIGVPYGTEVFKALVTEEPSVFSPLFSRQEADEIQRSGMRGGNARGVKDAATPLGQLLLTATTGRTRGKARGGAKRGDDNDRFYGAGDASRVGAPVEGWTTYEITFVSLPPASRP
jgi:hypothetical protein